MSMFSPDVIFAALAKMLGYSPAQLQAMVVPFLQRINAVDAEIEGFKRASGAMVAHYNARLDAIDAKLDLLLRHADIGPPQQIAQPINGRKVISDE